MWDGLGDDRVMSVGQARITVIDAEEEVGDWLNVVNGSRPANVVWRDDLARLPKNCGWNR